jgi:hypothetical protein
MEQVVPIPHEGRPLALAQTARAALLLNERWRYLHEARIQ